MRVLPRGVELVVVRELVVGELVHELRELMRAPLLVLCSELSTSCPAFGITTATHDGHVPEPDREPELVPLPCLRAVVRREVVHRSAVLTLRGEPSSSLREPSPLLVVPPSRRAAPVVVARSCPS